MTDSEAAKAIELNAKFDTDNKGPVGQSRSLLIRSSLVLTKWWREI